MRVAAPLALAELVRAPGRTLLRVLTLAAAVGLLGAMLLFVGHSLGTMTASAVRSVPLDWQGPVGSGRAATAVARRVARQPGVAEACRDGDRAVRRASSTSRRGGHDPRRRRRRSSPCRPATSRTSTPSGSCAARCGPGEVVLDQQLAATLQAQPGDTIALTPRRGAQPLRLRVSGVALVTAPDVLFQPLNPLLGPAPGAAARQHRDPAARDLRGEGRARAAAISTAVGRVRRARARRPGRSGRCRRRSTRRR